VDPLVELVHVLRAASQLRDLEQGRLCLGGAGLSLQLPLEGGDARFEGGARGRRAVRRDSVPPLTRVPVRVVIEDSERRDRRRHLAR
jgi:hypothetical protein